VDVEHVSMADDERRILGRELVDGRPRGPELLLVRLVPGVDGPVLGWRMQRSNQSRHCATHALLRGGDSVEEVPLGLHHEAHAIAHVEESLGAPRWKRSVLAPCAFRRRAMFLSNHAASQATSAASGSRRNRCQTTVPARNRIGFPLSTNPSPSTWMSRIPTVTRLRSTRRSPSPSVVSSV
jgi:hypothetical protein